MNLTTISSEDMTLEEKESLQNYIDNGCPGLLKATETDIFKWFELYMSGKTYEEISRITNSKKDLVLYVSHKSKWAEKRMAHYNDLVQNMSDKLTQIKYSSANTISTIVMALNKYYQDKFNAYLSTKNADLIEGIDTKMLAQFYKSIESLDKIVNTKAPSTNSDKNQSNSPIVNVNLGNNATIEEREDGSVEISDDTASQMLNLLSKMKKNKDNE